MSEAPKTDGDQFLKDLAESLSHVATVSTTDDFLDGLSATTVIPARAGALEMSWIDAGDEVIFEAGSYGGRWELSKTLEDLQLLGRLVDSVVAGRVEETFGPRRSRVVVTFADGSTVTETGYVGCLPIPFWRRRGRVVQYLPYEIR